MTSPANLPVFLKKEFLAWLAKQSGAYDGLTCANCALAQFGRAMIGEECQYAIFTMADPSSLPVELINAEGRIVGLIAPFSAIEMKLIIKSKTFEELRENFNVNP